MSFTNFNVSAIYKYRQMDISIWTPTEERKQYNCIEWCLTSDLGFNL